MVANDDLKSKINHYTGFYSNSISGQKILKPAHSVTKREAIARAILNAQKSMKLHLEDVV
jgi:hypothetical protein